MTQKEISELLSKTDKWLTSREISEAINVGKSTVDHVLKSMRKYNLVKFKKGIQKTRYHTYLYQSQTGK